MLEGKLGLFVNQAPGHDEVARNPFGAVVFKGLDLVLRGAVQFLARDVLIDLGGTLTVGAVGAAEIAGVRYAHRAVFGAVTGKRAGAGVSPVEAPDRTILAVAEGLAVVTAAAERLTVTIPSAEAAALSTLTRSTIAKRLTVTIPTAERFTVTIPTAEAAALSTLTRGTIAKRLTVTATAERLTVTATAERLTVTIPTAEAAAFPTLTRSTITSAKRFTVTITSAKRFTVTATAERFTVTATAERLTITIPTAEAAALPTLTRSTITKRLTITFARWAITKRLTITVVVGRSRSLGAFVLPGAETARVTAGIVGSAETAASRVTAPTEVAAVFSAAIAVVVLSHAGFLL
ncbi:hypothetical protein [Arthrobacter sp. PAMC25564]|uniref:hypothetical protein n=1 Tax=Arthrobacter sp. PAMC25564 TaxID=2565366 RepID=UPI001F0FA394|nr:hypothetical protein [Arthrobacter sp. PAMC25564]